MAARLTLLTAGATAHRAGIARRGAGWATIRFPALVAVIEHPRGTVVFDTGYAPRVSHAMLGIDRLYGALLPVHVTEEETMISQLAARGIDPRHIAFVVLSHLHADHIGGLLDLPTSPIVADPAAVAAARRLRGLCSSLRFSTPLNRVSRLRAGLLPALLPDDLCERLVTPQSLPVAHGVDISPFTGYDLLGDETVVVVPLPGHGPGHLGLLVRTPTQEVLLVGDAAWSSRAISHRELPHPVARIATADWRRYTQTINALHALGRRRTELILLPSHDEQAINAAREEALS